jgi:hypothetical protein
MMRAMFKSLICGDCFRFSPTRWDAIITTRRVPAAMGQGHNGAQNGIARVVPLVVGKMPAKTACYPPPTTLQRKIETYTHACTCARARVRACPFFRCAVVSLSYVIERYKKKGTTHPTTQGQKGLKALWVALWATANPLEMNKKGGFARG